MFLHLFSKQDGTGRVKNIFKHETQTISNLRSLCLYMIIRIFLKSNVQNKNPDDEVDHCF